MFRLKIFKMIFLVMFFSLALNLNGVTAQDPCKVPTVTKEVNFPEGWYDFLSEAELSIICDADGKQLGCGSACDVIDRNACVDVHVGCVGAEIPPYSWSISGTGFHFNTVAGPTTWTSQTANETVKICADNTACGTGTVTVTDACGNTGTDYVRCENSGLCLCKIWWNTGDCSDVWACGGPEYYYEGMLIQYIVCNSNHPGHCTPVTSSVEMSCDPPKCGSYEWSGTICPEEQDPNFEFPYPSCEYDQDGKLCGVFLYVYVCP
jgi:hypothetical protein